MTLRYRGARQCSGAVAGLALAATFLAWPLAASAQTSPGAPFDKTFVTKHTGVFGKEKMSYTATVRSTVLPDDTGKPGVNFVTTDYVRTDVKNPNQRPVIFGWAGGPSGASVAYHTHILGPKRIMDPQPGHESEPTTIIDNPDWLLDVADIVMVDPAETGFSRVLPGAKRDYYYSVGGDTKSIEQFMDIWLKAHGRENAPRYVMGGSYGSVRAIRIAYDLRNSPHPVDGIFVTANCSMLQEMNGLIGAVAPIPTRQMIAIYHGKVEHGPLSDAQIVDDAYKFAMNEYLPALATIQDLTPEQRSSMAAKLAARTGIGADVYLAHDLVLPGNQFNQLLLKDKNLVLSVSSDARKATPAGAKADAEAAVPPLFLKYLKDDLKVTYPMDQYNGTAPDTRGWKYDAPKEATRADGGNDWPKMVRETLEADPKTRMYSANGDYDNQCVVGQARWLFSHTKLPRDRVTVRDYPGPHGLYMFPSTAVSIAHDLRQIIAARGE